MQAFFCRRSSPNGPPFDTDRSEGYVKMNAPLLFGRGPNRVFETACLDAKVQ